MLSSPPPTLASWTLLEHARIWTWAAALAFVASAETLLSASAVDRLHQGDRTHYNQELLSQGLGNTLCGLLGVLPVTGVIARSSVNVEAGGQTRQATVLHGFWLLLTVALIPEWLEHIPVSTLAALLLVTGARLAHVNHVRRLLRHGRREIIIFAWTFGGVVTTDLLHGVLVGLLCSLVMLIFFFVRLDTHVMSLGDEGYRLELHGAACFITLPRLAMALDALPPGIRLHLDTAHLHYIDAACIEHLERWELRQGPLGGELIVNWRDLEAYRQLLALSAS